MRVRWLVNGHPDGRVEAADRGLAYGDGLFETMAVHAGAVPRLEHHFDRLVEGCDRLAIPRPDLGVVAAEIGASVAGLDRAVAKLVLTRGTGERGYRPPADAKPTRILSIGPWPGYDASHYTRGIVLENVNVTVGENEWLAGLKHLSRLEQVLAQMELAATEADEGVQRRADGAIVGGTSTNLFTVRDGSVATPAIVKCGVRGVMRRLAVEACERLAVPVAETELFAADLLAADELFVTSAVAGVRPVRRYGGRDYEIGPVTRALQRATDAEA